MGVVIDPEGAETRVLREMVDLHGAAVIEIGCGDGRLTRRYARRARSVLGIDPNGEAIARARAATPKRLREAVAFQVGDATHVELSPAAFDVAILSWSL
jgi:ubiquinone/menaquinone biosynthesis C-methylase UbiE